jgi:DNA-binding SARP family transcriptional activator
MWIGLLGPLDIVTSTGQSTYLSAAKQRAALAALAMDARDVVPVDALAAAIWNHELPPSWRTTMRNYIRRLRSALGADGSRIVARPSGYLLQADDDEIDVLAFQSLRKAGLAAMREGDWTRASATFSDAEALWRGTPFADITSPAIRDPHLPYLRETLLAVLEARIDADLRLWPPRAADVIPDLQRLTSRHPERERLWALLMLALYRCGRQTDALTAFRTAREFCVSELGIERGQDLTDLQQRIITADPELLCRA